MICVHCGKQLDNDAEYCSRCGKKVIHVPPVFTMTGIGTDIAAEAIRDYSEWGFYNNPDAELDPETGRKPEYSYSALDALPDENPMKWARDFMEADAAEAAGETFSSATGACVPPVRPSSKSLVSKFFFAINDHI